MKTAKNYQKVTEEISQFSGVRLVSVVKNQPVEKIQELINAGTKIIAFGRVQEAEEKLPQLDFDGSVHFIGRLQKNKVKKAIRFCKCIQSVDSVELAKKISDECKKAEKQIDILLQVNISEDPNKAGFFIDELKNSIPELQKLPNINIRGIMTIGKLNASEDETREGFRNMKKLFQELKPLFDSDFTELSMGMSSDYKIALQEGATLVRVGKNLFPSV